MDKEWPRYDYAALGILSLGLQKPFHLPYNPCASAAQSDTCYCHAGGCTALSIDSMRRGSFGLVRCRLHAHILLLD